MKRYEVVIFDLFDTLIDFNRALLPEVYIDGTKVRSTSETVYRVFKNSYGNVDFNRFYNVFMESYAEFNKIKLIEHKELHIRERFRLMLNKMKVKPSDGIVEDMVSVHMADIAGAMEFPEENRKTLIQIKERNPRLAIISNFDHSPTAYGLLDRFGIRGYFERILISVDIGWRKPRADIFLKAFNLLRIQPEEAIFIGDSFEADIIGSKGVGMDAVWINRNGEHIKGGRYKPDYTVSSLSEIRGIL